MDYEGNDVDENDTELDLDLLETTALDLDENYLLLETDKMYNYGEGCFCCEKQHDWSGLSYLERATALQKKELCVDCEQPERATTEYPPTPKGLFKVCRAFLELRGHWEKLESPAARRQKVLPPSGLHIGLYPLSALPKPPQLRKRLFLPPQRSRKPGSSYSFADVLEDVRSFRMVTFKSS